MLIDSHCHLDFPDFADELPDVLARARTAGVGLMLTICTHVTRFPRVLALAEAHDTIWATVGIHPHEAGHEPTTETAQLVEMARHPKVVGFGETGLDYFYDHSPREDQQRSFRAHIAAARQAGLPVVIHTRDAESDTAAILAEEGRAGAFPGLIHCFSSGPEMAELAVAQGLYVSFSGIITFKSADALRAVVKEVPLDRILVETDAPYLAPVPKRGKRNEPAFVIHTAAKIAEIKGLSVDAVAQATTENFHRLFTKVTR